MTNETLIYQEPQSIAIEPCDEAAAPLGGQARVRTLVSAISRGTERLVFSGLVPPSEYERMRAPHQRGAFPFPVVYGYAAVGVVEDGPPDWLGRRVFALHPHQRRFTIGLETLTPLPEALPSARAALAANMETALNGLWDSAVGPGDRVAVVGGGVLGLLCAGLAAETPGTEVVVVDPLSERAEPAAAMGAGFRSDWAAPDAAALAGYEADVVLHTSATAPGLAASLALAGAEGTVAELSWYGAAAPQAPLGAAFHSRRLRVISSQVGAVAPARRPRWSFGRRLAKAVELLRDDRYDALVTTQIPFAEAPERLPAQFAPNAPGLATVLTY